MLQLRFGIIYVTRFTDTDKQFSVGEGSRQVTGAFYADPVFKFINRQAGKYRLMIVLINKERTIEIKACILPFYIMYTAILIGQFVPECYAPIINTGQ